MTRWLNSHRLCSRCRKLRERRSFKPDRKVCKACEREDRIARYEAQGPEERLYWFARSRAKKKGIEFNLSVEDIEIPEVCPVLGTPMKMPSLDRFDNTRGYTPDNIRVISARANMLKSDGTLEEIERVVAYMKGER